MRSGVSPYALSLFLLGSCMPAAVRKQLPPPVVFIHGVKGATLVNAEDQTVWLTAATALGWRHPALALPMHYVGQTQQSDGLRATEPLGAVTLIPGLLSEKVYAPFLTEMRDQAHPFYPFVYDWRRSNLESLQKFTSFVQQVRAAHGDAKVRVIAHSMGGLITLALLNEHPEFFSDVVFAGVPFGGGIGFLQDLHAGVPVGRNEQVLGPAVLCSYPSIYSFFPLDGHGLIERDGKAVAMDFYDAAAWRKNKLGMFAPGRQLPQLSADALEEFLRRMLPQVRQFRALLAAKAVPYPPILVVSGRRHPALMEVMRAGPVSVYGWDFVTAAKELGDGRVSVANSRPYAGIPHRIMYSDREHADLLNDPAVWQALRNL